MPIIVQCSGCGGKFRAPDEGAGKRVKCPKCANMIEIPGLAQAQDGDALPQPRPPMAHRTSTPQPPKRQAENGKGCSIQKESRAAILPSERAAQTPPLVQDEVAFLKDAATEQTVKVAQQDKRPGVPMLVVVYGWLFIALFGSLGALLLLRVAVGIVNGFFTEPYYIFFNGALGIAPLLGAWAGARLKAGRRRAVYGLILFGTVLTLAGVSLLLMGEGATIVGGIVLVIVAILFLPPLVTAFAHWDRFF